MCGSLQRRSANRAVLEVARAHAEACGSAVHEYEHLAEVPAFNVDAPDAVVADWRRRVAGADAVLIAAPEYAGGVAGVVKNALDWLVGTWSAEHEGTTVTIDCQWAAGRAYLAADYTIRKGDAPATTSTLRV